MEVKNSTAILILILVVVVLFLAGSCRFSCSGPSTTEGYTRSDLGTTCTFKRDYADFAAHPRMNPHLASNPNVQDKPSEWGANPEPIESMRLNGEFDGKSSCPSYRAGRDWDLPAGLKSGYDLLDSGDLSAFRAQREGMVSRSNLWNQYCQRYQENVDPNANCTQNALPGYPMHNGRLMGSNMNLQY